MSVPEGFGGRSDARRRRDVGRGARSGTRRWRGEGAADPGRRSASTSSTLRKGRACAPAKSAAAKTTANFGRVMIALACITGLYP